MAKKLNNVCIIGLGLMGGSLALAIKRKKLAKKVIGVGHRKITVRKALKKRAINEGFVDAKKGVKTADLVFICTPIRSIIPMLKRIAKHLKPGCIVTDVGSVKGEIVRSAVQILPRRVHFIGGHPMVGSEQAGFDAAFPTLYEKGTYILTPTKKTSRRALKTLESFLKRLKGKIIKIAPEKQDKLVAGISHLPLAIAVSLVNTIAGSGLKNEYLKLASSGFRDTTRVASGSVRLSEDLLLSNKKALLPAIAAFKNRLSILERSIKKRTIKGKLVQAKRFRDKKFSS